MGFAPLVWVGPSMSPWLECVNDDKKKTGLRREMHMIGQSAGRIFMKTPKLYKHGKYDLDR